MLRPYLSFLTQVSIMLGMKIKQKDLYIAVFALLLVYMAALCYMLLASEGFGRTSGLEGYSRLNLMPFQEIRRFLIYHEKIGLLYVLLNVGGNIIGFVPMGVLYPLLFRRIDRWYKMLLAGGVFSLAVESMQYVFRVGIFDVDDLILNTIGTILGYGITAAVYRIRKAGRRTG